VFLAFAKVGNFFNTFVYGNNHDKYNDVLIFADCRRNIIFLYTQVMYCVSKMTLILHTTTSMHINWFP